MSLTGVVILRYANRVAAKNNVKLSPAVRAFFISLVHLFEKEAVLDDDSRLYRIQLSNRELSQRFGVPYRTTCFVMKKLEESALIQRVPVKKNFRRLVNGEYCVNEPNITLLDLDLLNKEAGDFAEK